MSICAHLITYLHIIYIHIYVYVCIFVTSMPWNAGSCRAFVTSRTTYKNTSGMCHQLDLAAPTTTAKHWLVQDITRDAW